MTDRVQTWMISGTAGTTEEFTLLDAAWKGRANHRARRWALPDVDSVAEAAGLLVAELESGRGPVLPIGHSAGGIVAARAAVELESVTPGTVVGVVLLDSNMPAEAEAVRAKQQRFLTDTGPRTPSREEFLDSMEASLGPVAPEVHEQVMARMEAAAETSVRTRFWPDVLAQDTVALWRELAAAGVPVLYLQATRPVSAEAVARLHPGAVVRAVVNGSVVNNSTDSAGHWVHLSHPAEVARAITAWRS